MKKDILLLLFTIIIKLPLFSQPARPVIAGAALTNNGDIRGIIQDSTTAGGIEYATVGLYRLKDSSLVSGVVTSSNGNFQLKGIATGDYYLQINFLGYTQKQISPVSLTSQRTHADIGVVSLHPDITHIGEVQVVAQDQRVEYKIDKKVVNVAQDLASAGGTLVNVLENTPSVEVDVEGNVSLRGSSNFQLLVDGRPSVVGGSEGLQQIPASAVQSIEIITSPSAKYDPDGNAGIINVIMKKQKNTGFGGVLNISAGTKKKYTSDLLLNFKRNKINYFIGGEFSDQHFNNKGEGERRSYPEDTITYILSNNTGIFSRKSLSLKSGFDFALSSQSTLSLSGVIGERNFDRDFNTRNNWYTLPASKDSFYLEENYSNDKDKYFNLNLDFLRNFGDDGHKLQASVYYSGQMERETEEENIRKTDNQYRTVDGTPTRTRSRTDTPEKELRLELDYSKPVGTGKIETGLQSRWDANEGKYIYEDYQPFGAEWIRNDTISNTLNYLDAMQSGYFIFSGPLGKFEYQAGIRAEYDHRELEQKTSEESFTYEKLHIFPSAYLTRKLSDAHQLQLTYSRRIQRPRERDLNPFKEFRGANNVFFGNPALRPEFTNAYEFNYQYTFKKGLFSLETYFRQTYDKITQINGYDTLSGRPVYTFTMTNADQDYSLGIELMTNLELTEWWQLNLTGNLFHYKLIGDVEGIKVTSTSNSWRTNFNTTLKLKWDTRFQFSGFYNGPSNTLQGKRDGFFVANVALRKDLFKKQLTLSLNARDIFSTGSFSFTSEGSTFYTSNKFRRESPVVTINLSYRINNYRQNANRRDNEGGSESGGIDEMM